MVFANQSGFGKLNDLAAVQSPVTGKDEDDDADKGKGGQIGAAEHFYAEQNGANGAVGNAAKQPDQSQSGGKPGVHAQKIADDAAKGCANAEGRDDLSTLEARCQRDGGEDQL